MRNKTARVKTRPCLIFAVLGLILGVFLVTGLVFMIERFAFRVRSHMSFRMATMGKPEQKLRSRGNIYSVREKRA